MTQNSSQNGNDMEAAAVKDPRDKWIPIAFVAFFATIALLDGIFVYLAVTTQTGVVTERPYEKGLAYNEVLQAAKSRPDLQEKAEYKDGVLSWSLKDENGKPITDATVTALLKRPVQDGYDFDITLSHKGNGVYEAEVNTPMKGLWQAGLSSAWDKQKYQTSLKFVSR